jgi:hypothetical protein
MKKLKENEKYVGIHFNDVSVCLNYLDTLKLPVSDGCINFIKTMHNAVFFVNQEMPMNILSEICSRCANKILKRIEYDLRTEKEVVVNLKRYCKSDYLLS